MPPLLAPMKARLLGARYSLSFSYQGPTLMRRMNMRYRNMDSPTDVLAFPYSNREGEIVMCKSMIRKKSHLFGMRPEMYERFLFIHAALHLKGFSHGRIMSNWEDRWCRVFRIPRPTT